MPFEKVSTPAVLIAGASTVACFPVIAEAIPELSGQTTLVLFGPACVAAVAASAITAYVLNRVAKKKIDALTQEVAALSKELSVSPAPSGKHGVSENPQFSLSAIAEQREAAEQNMVGEADNTVLAEEEIAQSVANAFCQNPLELVEEKEVVPHKEDGLHTAIKIEDEETESEGEELSSQKDELSSQSAEITGEIDYEELAEAYVQKKSFKKRMLARSRGVQSVLFERLAASKEEMMEDIPVIRRADGSIGDVGESWWQEAALQNSVSYLADSDFGIDEPTLAETAEQYSTFLNASVSASFAVVNANRKEEAERSGFVPRLVPERSDISARVADPFAPEVSSETAEALAANSDPWQQALYAMDQKIDDNLITGMPQPVFLDVVGGSDTLDEPDGLEDVTNFLSFKTPAGHPEVTDTASYVNFLVENEFEAKSKGFGKHVKRYLKVS